MKPAPLMWFVIANVLVTTVLFIASSSVTKNVDKAIERTVSTLTQMNDQHTDFVRHMLGFVKNEAAHVATILYLTGSWLAVSPFVLWWWLRKRAANGMQDCADL